MAPEGTQTQKPAGIKKNTKLRIFGSFEEAAEAEAMDAARKPPMEGLRETVELILKAYGVTRQQFIERRGKMHIKIIRRG